MWKIYIFIFRDKLIGFFPINFLRIDETVIIIFYSFLRLVLRNKAEKPRFS